MKNALFGVLMLLFLVIVQSCKKHRHDHINPPVTKTDTIPSSILCKSWFLLIYIDRFDNAYPFYHNYYHAAGDSVKFFANDSFSYKNQGCYRNGSFDQYVEQDTNLIIKVRCKQVTTYTTDTVIFYKVLYLAADQDSLILQPSEDNLGRIYQKDSLILINF